MTRDLDMHAVGPANRFTTHDSPNANVVGRGGAIRDAVVVDPVPQAVDCPVLIDLGAHAPEDAVVGNGLITTVDRHELGPCRRLRLRKEAKKVLWDQSVGRVI